LPPLLTSAAISALQTLEESPEIVKNLQELSSFLHSSIESSRLMAIFNLRGHPHSPIKHLSIKSNLDFNQEYEILDSIVNYVSIISIIYLFTI
jgi:7-keto-8-aminopelargonate synthetase-like enzyme